MTQKATKHRIYYKSESIRPQRTEITSPTDILNMPNDRCLQTQHTK